MGIKNDIDCTFIVLSSLGLYTLLYRSNKALCAPTKSIIMKWLQLFARANSKYIGGKNIINLTLIWNSSKWPLYTRILVHQWSIQQLAVVAKTIQPFNEKKIIIRHLPVVNTLAVHRWVIQVSFEKEFLKNLNELSFLRKCAGMATKRKNISKIACFQTRPFSEWSLVTAVIIQALWENRILKSQLIIPWMLKSYCMLQRYLHSNTCDCMWLPRYYYSFEYLRNNFSNNTCAIIRRCAANMLATRVQSMFINIFLQRNDWILLARLHKQ